MFLVSVDSETTNPKSTSRWGVGRAGWAAGVAGPGGAGRVVGRVGAGGVAGRVG